MTPDTSQQEALASLIHHKGYNLLMDLIEGSLESIQADMSEVQDSRELLRLARQWQYLLRITHFLRRIPQNVAQELKALRDEAVIPDDIDLLSPRWFREIHPVPLESDDSTTPH